MPISAEDLRINPALSDGGALTNSQIAQLAAALATRLAAPSDVPRVADWQIFAALQPAGLDEASGQQEAILKLADSAPLATIA